jgi:hypothetical protein
MAYSDDRDIAKLPDIAFWAALGAAVDFARGRAPKSELDDALEVLAIATRDSDRRLKRRVKGGRR